MTRDLRPANWKRTVNRLRRYAEEMKEQGFQVVEPKDFETPPERRKKPLIKRRGREDLRFQPPPR